MQEHVKPLWEDEANVKGGKWVVILQKSVILPAKVDVADLWMKTVHIVVMFAISFAQMLIIVGEQFGEFGPEIRGLCLIILI